MLSVIRFMQKVEMEMKELAGPEKLILVIHQLVVTLANVKKSTLLYVFICFICFSNNFSFNFKNVISNHASALGGHGNKGVGGDASVNIG